MKLLDEVLVVLIVVPILLVFIPVMIFKYKVLKR